MKLLFDGTVYQGGTKYHGGGEYSIVIFRELLARQELCALEIFFDPRLSRKNSFFALCREAHIKMHAVSSPHQLRRLVETGKYTKLYSALPVDYYFQELMSYRGNTQIVTTIHGLRGMELLNEDMPPVYVTNCWKRLWNRFLWTYQCHQKWKEVYASYQQKISLCRNGAIITVSHHSKNSLLYYFPQLQENQVRVFYSPCKCVPNDAGHATDIFYKYRITAKNYGLIISANREEKNALRGILAYDRLFSRDYHFIPSDYKVIVLGAEQEEYFTKHIRNKKRFVFEKYVETAELESLYQHAQLFLYPTLNEGFGYPPLEAMKYGTLCACSAVTSIPEVCGDAVLYFNPICIDEIANRILQSFDKKTVDAKKAEIVRQYERVAKQQECDLEEMIAFLINKEKG